MTRLKAELISRGVSYPGFIESLSSDNIYFLTNAEIPPEKLPPGSKYKIKFRQPTGEYLDLECRLKWSYRTPPHGLTEWIGIELTRDDSKYLKFYRSLN